MLDLTGTSELRGKNEPKRLDLVLICTSVDCNLRTAMSTGKCCRAACKRPLCRWPNLAQHRPANAPAPTTKIPVAPALLVGLGNVHVVISLGILIISSIRNNRGSHSQEHRLPTHTPFSNLNSLIGIVHAPCFMFRNRNFPGGPGGKSGSPPDAEPWAPNPRPVEDRGLAIFVDVQKSV